MFVLAKYKHIYGRKHSNYLNKQDVPWREPCSKINNKSTINPWGDSVVKESGMLVVSLMNKNHFKNNLTNVKYFVIFWYPEKQIPSLSALISFYLFVWCFLKSPMPYPFLKNFQYLLGEFPNEINRYFDPPSPPLVINLTTSSENGT